MNNILGSIFVVIAMIIGALSLGSLFAWAENFSLVRCVFSVAAMWHSAVVFLILGFYLLRKNLKAPKFLIRVMVVTLICHLLVPTLNQAADNAGNITIELISFSMDRVMIFWVPVFAALWIFSVNSKAVKVSEAFK